MRDIDSDGYGIVRRRLLDGGDGDDDGDDNVGESGGGATEGSA